MCIYTLGSKFISHSKICLFINITNNSYDIYISYLFGDFTLINIFKEHDLDFIFCVCNASGLSAYHFIERRMAPLSAALAGVVLPHSSFGSHLDAQGNTVDSELEVINFEKAAEILCDIWSNITIDGHPVKC